MAANWTRVALSPSLSVCLAIFVYWEHDNDTKARVMSFTHRRRVPILYEQFALGDGEVPHQQYAAPEALDLCQSTQPQIVMGMGRAILTARENEGPAR